MPISRSSPVCRPNSAIPAAPVSGSRTTTPTALRANTCPKGLDLSSFAGQDLARITQSLHNRPCKRLGSKPSGDLPSFLRSRLSPPWIEPRRV